ISCLGASLTPAVAACRWPSHTGVRETFTQTVLSICKKIGEQKGSYGSPGPCDGEDHGTNSALSGALPSMSANLYPGRGCDAAASAAAMCCTRSQLSGDQATGIERYLQRRGLAGHDEQGLAPHTRRQMIELNGIAHIQLTVRDVRRSRSFYHKLLHEGFGMTIQYDEPDTFYCIGGRTGVLIRPAAPEHRDTPFDQWRIGLHHLCFRLR